MPMNKQGKVIVISGPSGVGKTTICNSILDNRSDVHYSISATSRPKRKSEEDGREYHFISEKEFKERIGQGHFIEYANVHGNLYGTPRQQLEEYLGKGLHVILDIDVQGASKLMKIYPNGIFIFLTPPNLLELAKRLVRRNTDRKKEIQSRLRTARQELKYRGDYKYVVENRDLEQTVKKVLEIIANEANTS